jgi:hypothetical protein
MVQMGLFFYRFALQLQSRGKIFGMKRASLDTLCVANTDK